jgi:hypothetical protein
MKQQSIASFFAPKPKGHATAQAAKRPAPATARAPAKPAAQAVPKPVQSRTPATSRPVAKRAHVVSPVYSKRFLISRCNAGGPEPISDNTKENAFDDTNAPSTAPPAKSAPKSSPHTPVGPGPEVVGHRIKVYWPLDDAWYEGVVTEFDAAPCKHKGAGLLPSLQLHDNVH